jgi:site-specific recombinase XerD
MRVKHIIELLEEGETVVTTDKTDSERKLYASQAFQKELKLFFKNLKNKEDRVIHKINKPKEGIAIDTYLKLVNNSIKNTLGSGYSSHSFRQGLITEMVEKGINTKVVAKFIGHSNTQTTLRYVKVTEEDIKDANIR